MKYNLAFKKLDSTLEEIYEERNIKQIFNCLFNYIDLTI